MEMTSVVEHLRNWWSTVGKQLETAEFYLFGSAVYQDGDQFEPESSDLDLIAIVPSDKDNAIDRFNWLKALVGRKVELEVGLVKLLKRRDTTKPIVSLIPITEIELRGDVHKSRVRDFFRTNRFLPLSAAEPVVAGLPGAGAFPIEIDPVRQVFEFCQEVRNRYLAISAIEHQWPLEWQSGEDPIPKSVMRHAAQIASAAPTRAQSEERFDLRVGLDYITQYVFARRHDDIRYRQLYEWISVRRGGRGDKKKVESLSHDMHLLMGEVLFDLAVSVLPIERAVARRETKPISSTSPSVSFLIGKSGLLHGTKDEQLAGLAEATLNLKWRARPYFSVVLEEMQQVEAALFGPEASAGPAGRIMRAKLLDRQRRLDQIAKDLVNGFQVLLFYQLVLFPKPETRPEDMLLALNSYSLLCYDPASYAASSSGGSLEAYNLGLKGGPIPYALTFGLPEADSDALLLKTVGQCGRGGLMELAKNNQSLLCVDQSLLAVHFVPQLLRHIAKRIDIGGDAIKNDNEYVNTACQLTHWDLGVR